jgi:hypothetical protein
MLKYQLIASTMLSMRWARNKRQHIELAVSVIHRLLGITLARPFFFVAMPQTCKPPAKSSKPSALSGAAPIDQIGFFLIVAGRSDHIDAEIRCCPIKHRGVGASSVSETLRICR